MGCPLSSGLGVAACGRRGMCACAARAHKRGETKFSPLLRITPFPSKKRAVRRLPEDLRHLLPQIRARSRAQRCVALKDYRPLLESNKKGKTLPLWGGSQPVPVATASGWKPFGGTTLNRARGAPEGKRMIGKKEETAGFFLLVRPPRRRNPARDARAPRFALSGEKQILRPLAAGIIPNSLLPRATAPRTRPTACASRRAGTA